MECFEQALTAVPHLRPDRAMLEPARRLAHRLLTDARQQHMRGWEAWALWLLGEIAVQGTPPDVASAAASYRQARDLADTLGMRPLLAHCHRFQPEGYECIPNLLLYAVHLAHVTQRIKIGCGFNIAPMWHPLRLAEDYATADILTGGRVIFGVGRGYHTREVETFGASLLDQPANRALFEEQVEIIFKAFNDESFSHQGEFYTIYV